ncbi:PREDICTED: graves disease carrier protein homolog isoform X1 [Vollenhovia emeryi]|uniref:graves disease carrier protein homolog isoform X1 n=2 Tax=Vollenhovia emeryi TaxID=411798 RepID=UPI0005F3705E|nr:PREDICTED: graves disease carrier protein homolog isoform X1 [Vollenhovia emeryi]XP_011874025.1 PREDICTED: graves disease carrier protein homolog isoform X2 [Vollenhovia emeryi]XP_011874026.1 PREDICTED: graves disease carrier protein homolog isoform X1 [Vollenhovia emeryi]XP_011874027.1 PREDICTED: graves disease carrier protein homolog isoform X1 [Vollenhovia emeryi]XP_011874028.1 PREDICTED: graves disease carrier protein homolog isoform X1 [Vollenhovia emeryi]
MTRSKKKTANYEAVVKNLVAGGVAGMCSKTAVAPLDRIKILLQAQHEHYKHLGVFSGFREIVRRENFFALYKGNLVQMIRAVPYAAIQFTAYERYKKHLEGSFEQSSHINGFLAGAAAGVTAAASTYPLDTIRARLAFQVTSNTLYSGIKHAAVRMLKEEGGLRALYRGFLPNMLGMVPYAGFSFYTFEKVKYLSMKYAPHYFCTEHQTNTGGLILNIPAKLLCGGAAGAVAHTFSYPLDVTKRRMQLAMMNPATHKYASGMLPTLRMIYTENGIVKGLYRGMSINFLRAVPFMAVGFATYEVMKQTLQLDTGIKL